MRGCHSPRQQLEVQLLTTDNYNYNNYNYNNYNNYNNNYITRCLSF